MSFFDKLAGFVQTNKMQPGPRAVYLLTMLTGGIASWVPPRGYILWKQLRRRVPMRASLAKVFRAGLVLSPLILTGLLPPLCNWRAFDKQNVQFLLLALFFGLCLERSLRVSFQAMPARLCDSFDRLIARVSEKTNRRLAGTAITVGVVLFVGYFSYFVVMHHYRIQTHSWALAIFDNLRWNLIRGEWFKASPVLGRTGSHLQYHATFLAYVIAPLYALRQQADALIVIQALIVGSAAFPIYLYVSRKMESRWAGLLLAYAFLIHAPMHGPLFYDFHFLTTAPFSIIWVLYLFETGRRG
ncbi:MAG: DUF2079 domain-containing protein [Polyangiaceae bacterium]|nr:DUF2079 domain-containing protein [Polyangiaceae bacterium]